MKTQEKIARFLLQSKAIKLEPAKPFTWASGWKSPIYCDNRITLSYPEIRTYIRDEFVKLIEEKYGKPDLIAGVATGAIAQGVLVAEKMGIPFVYVRPKPKEHGRENLIEGEMGENKKVVVVEDLVSTGGSSLKAVEALQKAGATVLGMVAIFTYSFPVSIENFKKANCRLDTLGNYESMLDTAASTGYINEDEIEVLKMWRHSPETWKK